MARKAGPGDGAGDAPEGRADLSPEEAGVLPDARPAGSDVAGAGPDPIGVEEARPRDDMAASPPDAPPTDDLPPPRDVGTDAPPEEPLRLSGSHEVRDPGDLPRESTSPEAEPSQPLSADLWRPGRPEEPEEADASRPEPLVATPSVSSSGTSDASAGIDAAPTFSPPPVAPRRRGGMGALLLGGMIAAALGFGAAWLAQDRLGLFPARLPADLDARLAALEARSVPDAATVQDLAGRLDDAEARLGALEESSVPVAGSAPAVDLEAIRQDLGQDLADAQARAAEIEERVAALEARPEPPTGPEAPLGSLAPEAGPAVRAEPAIDPEALRQEIAGSLEPRLAETEADLAAVQAALSESQSALDDLASRLDQAEAQSAAAAEEAKAAAASLTEAQTRAATAEAQAQARAALGDVEAALAAGEPFEAPLSALGAAGIAVPDDLSGLAAEGAPTLAALRESFPDAARAALAVARDQGLLDGGSGMLSFLRDQLSVRSVTPRDGEDPDAVLSRAEAQLAAGQLRAALDEIGSLPEPVRAAMGDWIAQAEARAQVDEALTGLRDALPAPDVPSAD